MAEPLQIATDEWSFMAGLIGFSRLYEDDPNSITSTGIQLRTDHLDTLADKYFDYLLRKYSVVDRDVKRMEWYINRLNTNNDKVKEYASELRKTMTEQLKKVEKYFPTTKECMELKKVIEALRNVKSENDVNIVYESFSAYKRIMSTDFINEKLTLNYTKTIILGPIFGQPSFLQPSFNSKTTKEHIEKMNKDFVEPAKKEMLFHQVLHSASSKEEIEQFLDEHKEYKPFKDWLTKIKKLKTFEEIVNFLKKDTLGCSFITELLATQSFEEMVFSPLGLSKDKAVNFNWNFNKKQPIPISAVARLLFFLTPIGFTTYNRKVGNETVSKNYRYFSVIFSMKPFAEIVKDNNTYQTLRNEGSTFGEAIIGLLSESQYTASKRSQGFTFVEFYSEYQTKKTLLDYYQMPEYLINYLRIYGNSLKMLRQLDSREEFLRTVLKGLDPKELISSYLRIAVLNGNHAIGAYIATRERWRIIEARKGEGQVGSQDKKIWFIYSRGAELRNKLSQSRSDISGPYKASGRKKIESIAYRLINASKAGDRDSFMDTLFRVHLTANLAIPTTFIESYQEKGLDFTTISSAFIAGLLGEEQGNNKEKTEGE
ncbi:type I-B CRISPR-associated protein Cas8b1/Cst1 [Heyndrickxia sporothermodurans]|uniref:Type I-B CRISPR-associated protein Cas8b1/Cst1 n=1 Tax=Heyndrickxia sporothermodurans TaxID=46224 RepID=A0A150LD65_9BACI|nr:type I-B CRISPR-associated protein Cas8b1/Cst1 [Heyndrickxia sporothermodurans]KYD09969.1 hypothetical protein B4102_2382 [Heyndrickxia sporothermodurans]MED3656100.1 type I-B CRISPR-associated protein Cas8b1/Cst1 [Heyndrickxia sporothermodurans]MED3779301.1 type I-B CRISPR-associated protein Cas8b1/Cst1 [Heyndrickxia sporothermodurans]